MNVDLLYGEAVLTIELPADRTTVIVPRHLPCAPDGRAEVLDALARPVAGAPLRELVQPGQTVAISVCDGTRAQPRHVVVPALLELLEGTIRLEDIVVLVATGTHRGNTPEELRRMLGDEVMDTVRVVNHDARDDSTLAWVGRLGDDVPVWLAREWLDADVRITTGFVEPHFFAGFSGGPKMVAPGLAALETVLTLHDARRIGDPRSRFGVIECNPIQSDVRAIAAATGTTFSLDVVLDRQKRIVRAFGGELFGMHAEACTLAREAAMQAVPSPFDVVITTNSGFPLDQNLYQAVKGMSAAAQVVAAGGTIVCAAECRDGFPAHGSFRSELEAEPSPAALLEVIAARDRPVPDQWQVQILAGIQSRSRVVMHTSYLSDEELAAAHLEQTGDIEGLVEDLLAAAGPAATLCVLPEGPQTIPYLAG